MIRKGLEKDKIFERIFNVFFLSVESLHYLFTMESKIILSCHWAEKFLDRYNTDE
jgi:hypothetical protein